YSPICWLRIRFSICRYSRLLHSHSNGDNHIYYKHNCIFSFSCTSKTKTPSLDTWSFVCCLIKNKNLQIDDVMEQEATFLLHYIKLKIKRLFPAYFAMIMTSGALSIVTYYLGMTIFSYILLLVNTVTYLVLTFLTLLRLIFFFPRLRTDLMSHEKGPGFFTLVAGTCVFGSQIYILTGLTYLSLALWILGILLWIVVMYTFFTSVTIRKTKPN